MAQTELDTQTNNNIVSSNEAGSSRHIVERDSVVVGAAGGGVPGGNLDTIGGTVTVNGASSSNPVSSLAIDDHADSDLATWSVKGPYTNSDGFHVPPTITRTNGSDTKTISFFNIAALFLDGGPGAARSV